MYFQQWLSAAAVVISSTAALTLDVSSPASIRSAASTIADGALALYHNAQVGPNTQDWQVGLWPFPPYYWWISGAAWGGLIDYGVYTGDTAHLNDTLNALLAQTGPNYDYVPPQQIFNEANDDQAFWIFDILSALEYNLPLLPCPNNTSNGNGVMCPTHYLRMADNAFNLYVGRYLNDSQYCNGGLRWQYIPTMSGYSYKNSISNGGFFNIAARLARYTGNSTYADWANRVWDWSTGVGFVTSDLHVIDGAGIDQNCTAFDRDEWTYNNGVYMYGAAAMADLAGGAWVGRTEGLFRAATATFFSPYQNATNVMYEQKCERDTSCNPDQRTFKAYLARWMGKSSILVPSIASNVTQLLQASAQGAAASCSGQGNNTCGEKWYVGEWDGAQGLGQQLSALEAVQGLLVQSAPKPARASQSTSGS